MDGQNIVGGHTNYNNGVFTHLPGTQHLKPRPCTDQLP